MQFKLLIKETIYRYATITCQVIQSYKFPYKCYAKKAESVNVKKTILEKNKEEIIRMLAYRRIMISMYLVIKISATSGTAPLCHRPRKSIMRGMLAHLSSCL